MYYRVRYGQVAALGLVLASCGAAIAQDTPAAQNSSSGQDSSAVVTLGGEVVMRLRASAGGMTPTQRVDLITDRLTRIITFPDIRPADVVVYTPAGKPPVIYALGRRVITVDASTVKSAGGGDAKTLAVQWAKRLQQVLPRVDIRLPGEPEPKVPANPPLQITSSLDHVRGSVGGVYLRSKLVMHLHGISPEGLTAVERGDLISARLQHLVNAAGANAADNITVSDPPAGKPNASVQISVSGTQLITVDMAEAKASKAATPSELAKSWAKNIRNVLGGTSAAPTTPTAPAAPTTPAAPETTPSPTAPAVPDTTTTPAVPAAPAPATPAAPPAAPTTPSTTDTPPPPPL